MTLGRTARAAHLAILALLLAGSCGSASRTLLVDVRTDLVPTIEFASVRLEIRREGDAASRSVERDVEDADDFLAGARVAELQLDEPGAYSLTAQLLAADGRRLAVRRAVVDVDADVAVTLLLTRSCIGVVCPSGDPLATECVGGRCVRPRCTDVSPDACGAGECTSDAECVPAQACAVGVCDGVGACVFGEHSGVCADEEWCHPDLGCMGAGPICAAGYGDCDGSDLNGCETPLDTDVDCGRCGAACAPANGTGECQGGDCVLLACDAGTNDCDGIASNGCETTGDCTCDAAMCTFMCSVACTAHCPAGSSCTLVCTPGQACSMTADMNAQVSLRCGGTNSSSFCGAPTCRYQCDVGCNCS
ncbi:MAG TPA: hypothetical protein DEF51_38580 [Myxococcales bacterium]|nr:hypothetical protein [Myxococcales bacterium]